MSSQRLLMSFFQSPSSICSHVPLLRPLFLHMWFTVSRSPPLRNQLYIFPSPRCHEKEHRHKASLCAQKNPPREARRKQLERLKKKEKKRTEQKEITKETESNGITCVITLSFSLTDIQIKIERGSERDWVEEREPLLSSNLERPVFSNC